jgi:hypothetical protein
MTKPQVGAGMTGPFAVRAYDGNATSYAQAQGTVADFALVESKREG